MTSGSRTGLRAELRDGPRPLVGIFVMVPRTEVVEMAAAAGFDLVVLDCEHGPFGVDVLPALLAAARGAGLRAIVRVPENSPQVIGAVLDAGADGVLVPHVDSGRAASEAVRASRFPPAGERSVHGWVRAARYGADGGFPGTADDTVAVIVMAEGAQALENLDDVLATPGLDGVFVGPMDLAASLGMTGTDPCVQEIARNVLARVRDGGLAGGIFTPTPTVAATWVSAGTRLVVLSVDAALIARSFDDALGELSRLTRTPAETSASS
jgi:4-hydroxy-2-oxoheptanedioate aldolase